MISAVLQARHAQPQQFSNGAYVTELSGYILEHALLLFPFRNAAKTGQTKQ